jgi:hypothetical protein
MKDMFCYIARAGGHVNPGFCQGASLPDPKQVLKLIRHIKLQDLEQPLVRQYIFEVAKHGAQPATRTL